MTIDAVASYHTSPFSCGVARFSQALAAHLHVPFLQLAEARRAEHPLLSIKFQELLTHGAFGTLLPSHFDLFAHDDPLAGHGSPGAIPWASAYVERASHVYAANERVAEAIRARYRRDVTTAWCPSALTGDASRGYRVLTFGMAGRLARDCHRRLRALLDADGRPWSLCLSCAVHEGHDYEPALDAHVTQYRALYGPHLRVLGCLADDGLEAELAQAHLVALFFEDGAQANNTTLWAALERGKPVVTNLTSSSPPELQHGVNVFDIAQLDEVPPADQRRIVRGGAVAVARQYGWGPLVSVVTQAAICA